MNKFSTCREALFKGILGENKFRELEDRGFSFLLGITEDVPLHVVEITNFLCQVWGKRLFFSGMYMLASICVMRQFVN